MKRLTFAVLLCAAALSLAAGVAQAKWSEPEHVLWKREHWNTVGTTMVNSPDTTWTTLAASKVDTTKAFSLLDCDTPFAGQYGMTTTTADSIPFAHVVIYGDSSVAGTLTFGQATCAVQVKWGDGPLGWTTVKTYTCTTTDAVRAWNIPLFNELTSGAAGSTYGKDLVQENWQFAPSVRLIVTGAAGTAVQKAAIKLVKYRDPSHSFNGGATGNY